MELPVIKKDYVTKFKEILYLKGHQNCMIVQILLNRWILPSAG